MQTVRPVSNVDLVTYKPEEPAAKLASRTAVALAKASAGRVYQGSRTKSESIKVKAAE